MTAQVEQLGPPILAIGGVENPWGVAITPKGEVVVSENKGHCVSVFSTRGEKLRSFGTRDSGQGQFTQPTGVAVDGEGNNYSSSRLLYAITIFRSSHRKANLSQLLV